MGELTSNLLHKLRVTDNLLPVVKTIDPDFCNTIILHDREAEKLGRISPFRRDVMLESVSGESILDM